LQEKEIERLGDIKTRKIDIRIIAASNKDLKNISFYSSFELENVVIIVTKKQDVPIFSMPDVLDKIKQFTQKEIRFLERTKNPKTLVESLLHPVPVISVTTLYIPPFSDKEYKIEIEKKYKDTLPIPEEVVVQTVSSVLETEAFIEFCLGALTFLSKQMGKTGSQT